MEIQTKTIPNTQTRRSQSVGYRKTFEDRNEDYIKQNLGVKHE